MPQGATVDAVKVVVARQCGFSDHNRIGLYNPATKKTLKDRNAVVLEDADVATAKELLVKDLGTSPSLASSQQHDVLTHLKASRSRGEPSSSSSTSAPS